MEFSPLFGNLELSVIHGDQTAMHLDVRELRAFYYRSFLGRSVQATIREQVLRLWPQARHEAVLGYGFAAPLLRPYLSSARRVTALMPARQGVMHWPPGLPNC